MSQFGRVLKELRTQHGWSQKELAEACQLSGGYVGLLETGQRTASLETIAALASALRCSPADRDRLQEARRADCDAKKGTSLRTIVGPNAMWDAASMLGMTAAELNTIVERVRHVSHGLGVQWGGQAAVAYQQRIEDWEAYASRARDALVDIAETLQAYASSLDEMDRAVAGKFE